MHTRTLLLLLLATTTLAQTPILVKDIKPGNFSGIYTTANAAVAGNSLYFNSVGTSQDEELWKTDGTEAGTVLVKDIYVGSQGSQQKFYTVYDGQVYFTAFNPDLGTELWRTDDAEGAVLVAGDVCAGSCSGAFYGTTERLFGEYEGKLYFRLKSGNNGLELWVSDGTPSGTLPLRDMYPGSGDGNPYGFTVLNGKLYFAADSTGIGSELWVSDGTANGTYLLKNINTSPFGGSEMDTPVLGPDAFYFWAKSNSGAGAELWKSDGTANGTLQLKEIKPGSAGGQPPYVPLANSAWLNNQLLFTADDGTSGAELWITDGTETGTQLLMDINPGAAGSNLRFLSSWNGKVYFRAQTADKGHELWVSDGTLAGTQLLKDINPGVGDGLHFSIVHFVALDDKILFTANDGAKGREIWVTDGTPAGTHLMFDLNIGAPESAPSHYQVMGDQLFFFAETATTGRELWKLSLATSTTQQPRAELAMRIYPTLSSNGDFYLESEEKHLGILDVQVINALGQISFHSNHSASEPLNLTGLPNGSYWIRVAAPDGRMTIQKVFIQG